MVTVARMEPGCFGSNSMYCPVVWLSLRLAGCLCGSSSGTVVAQKKEISYELLCSAPENLVEEDLGLNQGVPSLGACLCRGLISVGCMPGMLLEALLCSVPGSMCERLPGKAVTSGSRSFLSGREWWGETKATRLPLCQYV